MMAYLDEDQVEIATVDYFHELGYEYAFGPDIAPDGPAAERADYGQVVLGQRLRDALLPKLISGELRVKDAERFLKERGL